MKIAVGDQERKTKYVQIMGLGKKLLQGIPNRSQELLDVWVCHKLLLAILDCQLQPTTKTSEIEVAPRSALLALLTMLTWFTLLTCLIA